jgi:type IV pilus assembly protein PilB
MAATAHARLTGLPRRLVRDGVINESIAAEAEAEAQKSANSSIVSYLVEKNLADPRDIASAACHEFGVPVLDLDAIEIDLDTARLVDEKLMRRHRVLPLFRRGRRVYLGVSDPTRLQAIDEIKFATGMSIEAIVVEDNKLDAMLMRLTEALDTTFQGLGGDDLDLENLDISEDRDDGGADVGRDEIDDAPIVRFVNKILLDAINRGASDIHFEPYEKFYRVRTRLDGVLKEITRPPVALANKVTARIKVMSRMDIAERRVPQDGRIKLKLSANRAIDFRVNTLPTLYGEKVVMRILDPSQAKLGIDALGYEDFQKQLYLDALSKPYGMILVTGPTGSGKTVSLYTGLNILNTDDRNISTAEDPAEINLPGVNQVNVNPRVGLTFASALRAFLRQDPDIIMVGEIRDLETAEIAIKAAQTGHLVLSTLHTNDAPQDPDAHGRHGRRPLRDRLLGQPDHRPAACAPAVRRLQGTARDPARGAAARGLHGGRGRRGPHDLWPGRLQQVQRRLQGPRGHLPGHAGVRDDRPDYHGGRQRDADRGRGRQGRHLGPAPRRAVQGQERHHQPRGNQSCHDRLAL